MDYGYLGAWGAWFSGQSIAGDTLYGVSVLWWARGGKIIAFLSSLAIVAELLGPDRLERLATGARERLSYRKLVTMKNGIFLTTAAILFGPALVLSIVVGDYSGGTASDVWTLTKALGWAVLLSLTYAFAFWMIFLIAFALVLLAATIAARLLRRESSPTTVRVLSLLVVVVGFHFDLLGS